MFYASIIFEIFAYKYDFFVQLVQSILKYNRGIDMQNVLLRLREVQPSLSSTERQIAQFILENPDETTTLTIRDLARRSFSSPSSVGRICRAPPGADASASGGPTSTTRAPSARASSSAACRRAS